MDAEKFQRIAQVLAQQRNAALDQIAILSADMEALKERAAAMESELANLKEKGDADGKREAS